MYPQEMMEVTPAKSWSAHLAYLIEILELFFVVYDGVVKPQKAVSFESQQRSTLHLYIQSWVFHP